jgi:hypothetical protein
MKRGWCYVVAGLTGLMLADLGPAVSMAQQGYQVTENSANSTAAAQSTWPKQIPAAGGTITMYQPTLDKWEGNQLTGRAAISLTTAASSTPLFGVVWFTARTEVDKQAKQVTLNDIQLTKLNLPVPAGSPDYLAILRQNATKGAKVLPLEKLEAELAIGQAEQTNRHQPIKNDPPTLYFSQMPAVLVLIDGAPTLREVAGTNLLRIVNTRSLIAVDQSAGKYYLYVSDRWMETTSLDGVWSVSQKPPAALETVKQAAETAQTADLMDNPTPEIQAALDNDTPFAVYVSTTPAELIVTTGEPNFQPIAGTNLLWAQNTHSSLFMNIADQNYYLLSSGRWYRSKSLVGEAWSFVAGSDLPKDFAKIPENHPAGDALPSVPGTLEAKQALIAQRIPQTATVQRDTAQFTAVYDGAPQFQPIEGTSLQYAVNSPSPVIMVDQSSFYACQDGVWFAASSAQGPWTITDNVPAVIYTIPVTCPINYVTNAYVYGSTPEVVYVGYTPGYLGTYVEPYGCVVYGSGYTYRPWIGANWYGEPVTFGLGAVFDWTLDSGWSFGFGYGAGPAWRPWWGPWHGQQRYHNHINAPVKPGSGPWRFQDYNLNHHNVYNRWDHQVVASRPRLGNKPPVSTNGGLIAGRDGNVYRKGPNGWEVRNGNQWKPVPTARTGNTPRNPNNARPVAAVNPNGGRPGPTANPETPAHLNQVQQADALARARVNAGQVNPVRPPVAVPTNAPQTVPERLAPRIDPARPAPQPTRPPVQSPPEPAPQRNPEPSGGGGFGGVSRRDGGGGGQASPPRNNGSGGGGGGGGVRKH